MAKCQSYILIFNFKVFQNPSITYPHKHTQYHKISQKLFFSIEMLKGSTRIYEHFIENGH